MLNLAGLSETLQTFYTVKDNVKRLSDDLAQLRGEISALRVDHADLKTRVAVLEEARKTMEEQMKRIITETILDLHLRYAVSGRSEIGPPSDGEPVEP